MVNFVTGFNSVNRAGVGFALAADLFRRKSVQELAKVVLGMVSLKSYASYLSIPKGPTLYSIMKYGVAYQGLRFLCDYIIKPKQNDHKGIIHKVIPYTLSGLGAFLALKMTGQYIGAAALPMRSVVLLDLTTFLWREGIG